jgi:hypothetical protein
LSTSQSIATQQSALLNQGEPNDPELCDDKLELRLGAVYTLKWICLDRGLDGYTKPIVETLSAYVRLKTEGATEAETPQEIMLIADLLRELMKRNS